MPTGAKERTRHGYGRTVDCTIRPVVFFFVIQTRTAQATAIEFSRTLDEAIRWNI